MVRSGHGCSVSGLAAVVLLGAGGWLALTFFAIVNESRAAYLAYHGRHVTATIVALPDLPEGTSEVGSARVRFATPRGEITTDVDLKDSTEAFLLAPIPMPAGQPGESITLSGVGSSIDIVYDPTHPRHALPADVVKVPHIVHRNGSSGGPADEPRWTVTHWVVLALTLAATGGLTSSIVGRRRAGADPYGSRAHQNGARL